MNMQKKKSSAAADKAWNLLRLALSRARKVAVLKGGLKVKGLGDKAPTHQIHYLERQLSFGRSPDFPIKKDRLTGSMRFLFPCVGSKTVEFDYDIGDYEDGGFYGKESGRESYATEEGREEEEEEEQEGENENSGCEKKSQSEDEGIDSRAEKFIADFYGHKKLGN